MPTKKTVLIFGSTGSVGTKTLEVIKDFPAHFRVGGLVAGSNQELLMRQAKAFGAPCVGIYHRDARTIARGGRMKIFQGPEALTTIYDAVSPDIVIMAIAGLDALVPTWHAIDRGVPRIAIASKEVFVTAGELLMRRAKEKKVTVLPLDSEHSAIFQCIEGVPREWVREVVITCSGGSLLRAKKSTFKTVTPRKVLRHPKWKMGRKITVDSATLMNKSFEVIEAMCLFGLPLEKIKVVVHPEALVHSMVELIDSAVFAHMGPTDMYLPVHYALCHPRRMPNASRRLDVCGLSALSFEKPDTKRFPCLELGYSAARKGGDAPILLNAADEVCVQSFLENKIRFTDIPRIIAKVLTRARGNVKITDIAQVYAKDAHARQHAYELVRACGERASR